MALDDLEDEIDELVAHQRALRHARAANALPPAQYKRQSLCDTLRKHRHEILSPPLWEELAYSTIPMPLEAFADETDVEAEALLRIAVEELSALWAQGHTDGLTFCEAWLLEHPGQGAAEAPRRLYQRVKQRISRLLRQYVKKGTSPACKE